jgi:spermidine/putrescine transport system permease protein
MDDILTCDTPMILLGVLSEALLTFTFSLDNFVITFFTNRSGTTLPIYVFGFLRRIITPQVNAFSTVWITIVFIAVLFLQVIQNCEQYFGHTAATICAV